MPPVSDRDLIAAVLRGQIDAFATILGRYRDVYTRFAMRMLGTSAAADDALQSAFVRAFRSLNRCKEPDEFGDWFFRIVIDECRARAMRRSIRERRFTGEVETIREGQTAQPDPAGEIQRAIDQLDPIIREAFVLQYVEELTYPEIAAVTGANIPALETRVDRACARLRELLGRMYAEYRHDVSVADGEARDPGPPFVARIATPLRRIEVLNDTFEDRLMAKVQRPTDSTDTPPPSESAPLLTPAQAQLVPADAVPSRDSERRARLSLPVMGAIGTALAISAFGSGYAVRGRTQVPAAAPAASAPTAATAPIIVRRTDTVRVVRSDTVHFVRFVFVDAAARSVTIVGDFNGWNRKATVLTRGEAKGVWTIALPLAAEQHEYAFIVDGKRWLTDPLAPTRHDAFGTETSIVPALGAGRVPTRPDESSTAATLLAKSLPSTGAERVMAKIDAARGRGLPTGALENRALKFAAKGVAPGDIERTVAEQSERLGQVRELLVTARGREPSSGEVEAGAEALRQGAGKTELVTLAKSGSLEHMVAVRASRSDKEKTVATKRAAPSSIRQAGAPRAPAPATRPSRKPPAGPARP